MPALARRRPPPRLVALARRRDPTGTLTLRTRYAQAVGARFDRLRADLRRTVEAQDALGLRAMPLATFQPAGGRAFAFPTSEAKAEAFMAWLRGEVDAGILEVRSRRDGEIMAHGHWQDVYVSRSYQKGISDARAYLRRSGVSLDEAAAEIGLRAPIHADRVRLLFTRVFEELKQITEAMAGAISRTLSDALIEGVNPREAARRLAAQVDGIGRRRAVALARTEIIRAHAQGTLQEYRQLGVEEVVARVEAEILTAGDTRVCSRCLALEGRRFALQEAQNMLPIHPLCRCAWLPAGLGEDQDERRARIARARERLEDRAA